MPERVHEALIKQTLGDHLVGHVSRDSTAIEAREKPQPRPKAEKPKRKRGRPRKGEERPKEERRVKRQLTMSLPQMLDDLPESLRRRHQAERQGAIPHRGSVTSCTSTPPMAASRSVAS